MGAWHVVSVEAYMATLGKPLEIPNDMRKAMPPTVTMPHPRGTVLTCIGTKVTQSHERDTLLPAQYRRTEMPPWQLFEAP